MTSPADAQDRYYAGVPMVPFDLVKELVVALVGVGLLVVILAAAFSAPDVPAVTIASWAHADPVDFVTTATAELQGTSGTAQYGPPYNTTPDAAQAVGPIVPQEWAGVSTPIDTAQDFVLHPLALAATGNASLTAALSVYNSAGVTQQQAWLDAYTTALGSATADNGAVVVASGDYGPVPVLMANLLGVARTGGLDALLLQNGRFYQTDLTLPLLFLGDGNYLATLAADQHLSGDQWGVMNETGNYPGQTWLWLYSIWYQVPPFNSAPNADLVIVGIVITLTVLLALVPFIPVLRDIPRWIPVHRLIWRKYYRGDP
ncbi:MAG TPA: hypothetical protein VN771_02225 [Candidatus Baltobacteraceae bacterium]|nr:hypothetical protein [Candidatus Baltobacteraceae bacterium]